MLTIKSRIGSSISLKIIATEKEIITSKQTLEQTIGYGISPIKKVQEYHDDDDIISNINALDKILSGNEKSPINQLGQSHALESVKIPNNCIIS